MKKHLFNRLLSLVLAAVMVLGMFPAVSAAPASVSWKKSDVDVSWDKTDRLTEDEIHAQTAHKPTDLVRVSIVLEDAPTLKMGYSTMGIGSNAEARAYDRDLKKIQDNMAAAISAQALGGKELDVVWNLTLTSNIISANVPYGKLDAVKAVEGVKDVVLENRYEADTADVAPEMYSSAGMVGSTAVWQSGMTGAGTRIAVIDTGTDTDHQSFDADAYLYALEQNAAAKGMSVEEYTASLDLLDADEIAGVLELLNAYGRVGATAEEFYINEKLPFGANYVDYNLHVDHSWDNQGSHGSHVAGIATANRYIQQGSDFVDARSTVMMNGVAPDAQLITLKVFGSNPGPYDSDYFAAIEDAIWLGCDSVNLSLGGGAPGYSRNPLFTDLLDFMATTDTVVVMSAGNSGNWAEQTATGYLYNDGVSFQTDGSPGSYTNSLAVASVDNDGTVAQLLEVAGFKFFYTEMLVSDSGDYYKNKAIATLDTSADGTGTEYEYIFVDGLGKPEDFAGIDLTGKVVFCHRGEISFYEKANTAASLGAAAIIICNNVEEAFGMDLNDYIYTAPCVSVLQSVGQKVRAASIEQKTADGNAYFTGKITIFGALAGIEYNSEYYTMSTFSSWGVPGSLELKPEITAPGGLIWSVNGMATSGTEYELMSGTSMAAPQVTGMAALVAEYIQANGLDEQTGLSVRQLAQSLLMSTAVPMREKASGGQYYSILNQGSGLARVDLATTAESYILVDDMPDGKVKAELGDDPERTGTYRVEFTINNLSGEDMTYELSADLFTQDVFADDYGNLYLDTWTRAMAADVEFGGEGVSLEVIESGFNCDLNGDGTTNAADAEYLLDYLLGNVDELKADGDLNGDGEVTTYDAHLLLTKLTGVFAVEVPANGCVDVYVDMELTQETKEFLDTYYPTGAYVEAFIHAEPVNGAEGVEAVAHSIPVLAYYGSWTEPSMYDVGSYLEYAYGAETRAPYLYALNDIKSNYLTINYGDGKEYFFGGNPFVEEAEYLPERNSFNNKVGAMLQTLRFAQIRNADAAKILLENADTGEIYMSEVQGPIESAYYHVNMGAWQNPLYRLPLGLYLTGIPEGTRLNLSLVTAPEYYTWYDAETDTTYTNWEDLAEGAYLTTSFTIDNTAPALKQVELGENNTLLVTAEDNEYIAAVALLNAAGTSVLATAAANQTERGIELTTAMDLSNVFGSEFLLAIYDYAENPAVYEVTLELENERPYFTAINVENLNDNYAFDFVGMNADGSYQKVAETGDMGVTYAAEYVEGAVYAVNDQNELFVGMDDDLFTFESVAQLEPSGEYVLSTVPDMAYNKADGKLYALFYSESNNYSVPFLSTIDLYTGEMDVLGLLPFDTNCLAIDGEGNFYSAAYDESKLYTYTADVGTTGAYTLVGDLDGKKSSVNTMAWDHNTDELYWICNGWEDCELLKVDPATADIELVSAFDFTAKGLYIAYEPENDLFAPTDAVASVTVDEYAAVLVGTTTQLTAKVMPWNISDASVTWTTSDASVAVVDEYGVVTGTGAGTATITAASVLDPSKTGSCTVEVTALNKDLKGLVWDEEGQVHWASFNTDRLPEYKSLKALDPNLPVNTTLVANGQLYASTLDTATGISELYAVDPETFAMTKIGPSSIAYMDMAYVPSMGYGLAVYFNYIVLVDLETGDYAGAWDWTGGVASDLVGITYYGSQYNSNYNANMDFFLVLDSEGNVYQEAFLKSGSQIGYFNGPAKSFVKKIGAPVDYSYFQGFHFDGQYTYWTRFTEEDNIVELIAWDTEDTGNVYSVGTFPEGVWPVAGLYTDAQLNSTNALMDEELTTASIKTAELMTTVPTVELTAAAGSLNAITNPGKVVKPDSSVTNNDFYEEIDLTVTVPEEATNGILTVKYDADKLVCGAWGPIADVAAFSIDDDAGIVTVAFANKEAIPTDGAVAELSFWSISGAADTTEFTVTFTELNQNTDFFFEETVGAEIIHYCPSENFVDVNEGDWWHEAVDHAVMYGYMNGMDATHFGPGLTMNRAQFVTVLYRMLGEPEVNNTGIFTDVPAGQFYTDAAYWALEAGITTGTGDGTTFNPGGKLTRTELVTFMYRFAKYVGVDVSINMDLSAYRDADQVLSYAQEPWKWAVSNGIVTGMTADTLAPMALTNRAQAAVIFQRFDNTFEGWFSDWFISQL